MTVTSNIELEEGSDLTKRFFYKDLSTGLPKDTTGCVVELQIKFEFLATPAVYRSDVSPYILLGGDTGVIDINVPWLTIFNDELGKGSYNLYLTTTQGVNLMLSKGFLTIVRGKVPVTVPGQIPGNDNGAGNIFKGPHEAVNSLSVVLANDHPVITVSSTGGLGTMAPVVTTNSNGIPLGVMPAKAVGARFYLNGLDSVSFTISDTQPELPPPYTFTITADKTGPNWDENLSSGQMIYVTTVSGAPLFRWI